MNLEKKVLEYKNGNEHAFNDLYKETKGFARAAIYTYIQDPDTIEDLLQDTYMKAIKQINSYTSNNFSNWIYTIAKNTALDYIKQRHPIHLDDSIELPDKKKNPYLHFALANLEEQEREVFLMKVLLGHTTKKISSILDIKVANVNALYYQAKNKLKKMLEGINDEI